MLCARAPHPLALQPPSPQSPPVPHVTFVVATYRRAEALRCTLEALCLQHHADWDAVVVGDACDATTEAAVRAVADPRIAYYNLPERVGEQSGPNSVGLALASGDVVAFLNHDDLLLPDHLAYSLDAMGTADLFLGRGAAAAPSDGALAFTRVLPRYSDLRRLIGAWPYAFEPCSFWLIRTAYARRVGPWRSARALTRTPLQDWLLRAWRLGGAVVVGERLTGVKTVAPPPRGDGPTYAQDLDHNATLLERLRNEPLDALRSDMRAQIAAQPPLPSPDRFPRAKRVVLGALARLYLATGLDVVAVGQRARGRRGALFARISQRRTGAPLPDPPDLDALIAQAPSFRVV